MPSVITGIIGGIQGASAAHNAAAAQTKGYADAAGTVNTAVGNANPIIADAAGTAATGVTNAATAAGTGALTAAGTAGTGVTSAATSANTGLSPYSSNGSTAVQNLQNAGQFSFNPTDLQNTPGYEFQLQQGNRGITSGMAAAGLSGSGAAAKALGTFDTGLAASTYNQQYQNALQGYQTNANTNLAQANLGLNASTTAGANLLNAAQYSGSAGINASQYAGTTGLQGATTAGQIGVNAGNQQAQNLINAGVYAGNTQIGAGNATAQGDIGAANSWNSTLGAVGSGLNTVAGLGFGAGGGWSFGNIGTNLGNMNTGG